ncbi:MAG: DinB family protein [Agriterribacter sp.]
MEQDIIAEYNSTAQDLSTMIDEFSQQQINSIPYDGSWTAAQVIIHVTKSNNSIAQALTLEAKEAHRKPDERVEELENIFMNFTIKLKSPDFIIPAPGMYKKETVIAELDQSIVQLKSQSAKANLSGAIRHPAFGNITKLELLHFVVYHTKRHIHQLEKIYGLIKNI